MRITADYVWLGATRNVPNHHFVSPLGGQGENVQWCSVVMHNRPDRNCGRECYVMRPFDRIVELLWSVRENLIWPQLIFEYFSMRTFQYSIPHLKALIDNQYFKFKCNMVCQRCVLTRTTFRSGIDTYFLRLNQNIIRFGSPLNRY